jgi:hypothetical protein
MNYSKTWKSKQKFFQGSDFRPATLNEKLAIAVLVGATLFITAERIAWYLMGNLKIYW